MTGTIRMLKNTYGLDIGSKHTVVGETPSKPHWLLQGGKKHVNNPCPPPGAARVRRTRPALEVPVGLVIWRSPGGGEFGQVGCPLV